MILQCPHCQTPSRLEEKPVGDQLTLQFCCNKCGETFSIGFPGVARPWAARPLPVQQHDEFDKRVPTVAPPSSPDPSGSPHRNPSLNGMRKI